MTPNTKGYLKIDGYHRYYEKYGKPSDKTPILILHGGPGAAHYYLLGLALLSSRGRQVIFYDQLGCGQSDMPNDYSLWTIQTFIDELKALREQLGLKNIHLYGHSWGGMLAIEYMLTKPAGVMSAIFASSMIDMQLY